MDKDFKETIMAVLTTHIINGQEFRVTSLSIGEQNRIFVELECFWERKDEKQSG